MRTYKLSVKLLASGVICEVDVLAPNRDQAIYKAKHYPYANMEPSIADLVSTGLAKIIEPTVKDLMTEGWEVR